MRPDQLVAPDVQARSGFVGHQTVVQCFALDLCTGQIVLQALTAGTEIIGIGIDQQEVVNGLT
ncbi:hypothetical protein D3C85_1816430 [compost metagenome]